MRRKWALIAVALTVTGILIPIAPDADSPLGAGLSDAACEEGVCMLPSRMDCVCPDYQEPRRKPACY